VDYDVDHKDDGPITVVQPNRSRMWFFRGYLLLLCTLACAAVSYYFVVALPRHNREQLQLERERLEAAEQLEKAKTEEAYWQYRLDEQTKRFAEEDARDTARTAREQQATTKEEQAIARRDCDTEADTAYWAYVKLNATWLPEKNAWQAQPEIWSQADYRKKATLDYCYKRHGLK
jgi:hypothetical protein